MWRKSFPEAPWLIPPPSHCLGWCHMPLPKPITGQEKNHYDWFSPVQVHLRLCADRKWCWLLGRQPAHFGRCCFTETSPVHRLSVLTVLESALSSTLLTRLSSFISLIGEKSCLVLMRFFSFKLYLFWLCWVFTAVHGLSLVAENRLLIRVTFLVERRALLLLLLLSRFSLVRLCGAP